MRASIQQLPIQNLQKMATILFNLLIVITITTSIVTTNALSFNFSDFAGNDATDHIKFERSSARDGAIVLLETNYAAGRATYSRPVRVWDNATGRVTDFETRFAFVIDSNNSTAYGDGMAFFLAEQGMLRTIDDARGGSLGLVDRDRPFNASEEKSFVAVEFDIFQNDLDPAGEHVGIDVNSLVSVANVTWLCNVREGKRNEALVVYNSTTQELSVNFTGFRGNLTEWQFLSHKVDLKSLLPEEVIIGFSAGTGDWMAKYFVESWEFQSTLEVPEDQPNPSVPEIDREKKSNLGLALGLGLGGFVLVLGFCLVLCFLKRKKKNSNHDKDEEREMDEYWDEEFKKSTGPKKYTFDELARATGNFRDDTKLGQGGFGGVYKGFLTDLNAYVAVKRVSKGSNQGMKEYAAEVRIISKLRHRNLVQLIGWCHERGDLLLVYEYMPNGSLDSHLFKGKLLSWEDRYKIAQGLASALLYLHEEWDQCVVHRDIKSSNVMLDSNFNAKLGDFGLAKLIDHSKGSETVTNVAGTPGYMAPEFFMTYKASKETDIYSFGIVCLELACGRKPIDVKATEDQIEMVRWVWDLYGIGKVLEAADLRLEGEDFDARQIECLMVVGLWCAHPDHTLRPSIIQVIQALGFKNDLPSLPPKMPVPTYVVPSFNAPTSSISYGTSNFSEGQQSQISSSVFGTDSTNITHSSPSSSESRPLIYSS